MARYKWILSAVVVAVFLGAVATWVWFRNQPASQGELAYKVEEAFPNLSFDHPVGIYSAGDGSNRLFVLEQRGMIYVFENDENAATASVFLDIRDRVSSEGSEEGLLGLAFHPRFSENGFFFVDYMAGTPRRTVIARYGVVEGDPNQGDKSTEYVLLEVMQPYSNHNGGQLAFGPDGYLYIGMGDGGSSGDPQGNGQNLSTLLGKILRIDVDSSSPDLRYGIPSDNPFVGNGVGYREEIYAYGFRNPWRFSFDPETGWLWVADVGQNRVEEIDVVEKGGNYGWNRVEGNLCFNPSVNCNQSGLVKPVWYYDHSLGISVTGGFVYRGSRVAELVGAYVYGDFGSGRIWALRFDGVDTPSNVELLDSNLSITSFGTDEWGELYLCAYAGGIYRLDKA